jgi:REP element-mobilizing transposase RayT
LQNYDYAAPGAYFITICVQYRLHLFGNVHGGEMILNAAGKMIENEWKQLPQRFVHVQLDDFIIMPDHFHAVVWLTPTAESQSVRSASRRGTTASNALGDIVGAFKSITTHRYIRGVRANQWTAFHGRLWQNDYWEHIIRNQNDLDNVRAYIQTNPLRWQQHGLT